MKMCHDEIALRKRLRVPKHPKIRDVIHRARVNRFEETLGVCKHGILLLADREGTKEIDTGDALVWLSEVYSLADRGVFTDLGGNPKAISEFFRSVGWDLSFHKNRRK